MPRSSFPIELGLLCLKTRDKNWVALHSKMKSFRTAINEGRQGAVCRNRSGGQKGLKVARQAGGRAGGQTPRSPPLARHPRTAELFSKSLQIPDVCLGFLRRRRASRTGVEREEIDLFSPFSLRASRFVDCHGGRGRILLVRCRSRTPSFLNSQIIQRKLGSLQFNRQEV